MSAQKVLFLHGFAQSASTFAAKSSALRKALKQQNIQTYYLDAPFTISPEDLPFETDSRRDELGYRSWWKTDADNNYNIDTALESIKQCIKDQGPFTGVIGFSQGAALAAMVTGQMQELGNPEPLQFAIYFSGFAKNVALAKKYLAGPITVPTLHVIGELDSVVPSEVSESMFKTYFDPKISTIFKHPGGHFVPHHKPMIKQWVSWVVDQISKSQPPKKEDKDDLDDLLNQIDKLGKL